MPTLAWAWRPVNLLDVRRIDSNYGLSRRFATIRGDRGGANGSREHERLRAGIYGSSIGKKAVLAVTGVGLFGFVVATLVAFIRENMGRRVAVDDPDAVALRRRWDRVKAVLRLRKTVG